MNPTPPDRPIARPSRVDQRTVPRPVPEPAAGVAQDDGLVERLWGILRRRKSIVALALVLVPAAVLAYTLTQQPTYTAGATLLFRPSEPIDRGGGDFEDPDRAAATNDELVQLPVIAVLTARRLGSGATAETVRDSVNIDSSGQSSLVQITAESTSSARAAEIANTYADAYIAFRRGADRKQVADAIAVVQRSLDGLAPGERAGPEGRALTARLQRLETAELLQTGNAEVVQPATAPREPSGPRLTLNLALGVLAAAAVGLGLAGLLEMVDRRIRRIDELEQIYHLPVLARIPRSRIFGRRDGDMHLLTRGAEAEAFRELRTNLRFYGVERQIRSVLVVSPLPGDGKSLVARHLAITMASMGDNVCLVEADLHGGSDGDGAHQEADGLSSVLTGASLESALVEIPINPDAPRESWRVLTMLPSGPVPPNPSQLLERARMSRTIEELEERFDLVILDSPALGAVSDALPLVPQVSAVIVVSALGHTTRDAAMELRKQLTLVGGQPLGIVANFDDEPGSEGEAYYTNARAHGER